MICYKIHSGARDFINTTDYICGELARPNSLFSKLGGRIHFAEVRLSHCNNVQVLDVFIVLDESGSVGEDNYHTAIDFVRNFIEDLDTSVRFYVYTLAAVRLLR